MGDLTIRPFQEPDLEAWVALRNQDEDAQVSPDTYRHGWSRRDPAWVGVRLVGEVGGRLAGSAQLLGGPYVQPGWLNVLVKVDRALRRRGYGRALAAALEEPVRRHVREGVEGWVREGDLGSRAFADRLGFREHDVRFESVLELEGFQQAAQPPAGIRILTLTELGPDAWRQLHELYARLIVMAPDQVPAPSWEDFERQFVGDPDSPAESQLVALDGERWVGLAVHRRRDDEVFNAFTGVDPEHRGRGLAKALKVAGIERARAAGASRMRTYNHSLNAPMLAVNQSLGYRRLPGLVILRRAV